MSLVSCVSFQSYLSPVQADILTSINGSVLNACALLQIPNLGSIREPFEIVLKVLHKHALLREGVFNWFLKVAYGSVVKEHCFSHLRDF